MRTRLTITRTVRRPTVFVGDVEVELVGIGSAGVTLCIDGKTHQVVYGYEYEIQSEDSTIQAFKRSCAQVVLSIAAPPSVTILRKEVRDRTQEQA